MTIGIGNSFNIWIVFATTKIESHLSIGLNGYSLLDAGFWNNFTFFPFLKYDLWPNWNLSQKWKKDIYFLYQVWIYFARLHPCILIFDGNHQKNNLNRYQCYHGKHWSETMHRMRICQTLHNQSLYCNYHKMMSFPSHHGSIILSFLYFISSMFLTLSCRNVGPAKTGLSDPSFKMSPMTPCFWS